ncbi:MAG: UDP-N-acetylmuramoyl-L-alanyl-D-glutamate--2,6-diaminopimelate ligase [Candidatus Omnitrophica bacterium]|nr:UDP-N-acetylmuramoyl-L-alanyl-D-glutamate--2,6-diaminopimelate ligase [Candidatus Omnitrophota bacterium]
MRLGDLLRSISNVRWDKRYGDCPVGMLSCDSREEQPDGLFVALSGPAFNGTDFIKDAIARGAAMVAKTGGGREVGDYRIADKIALIDVQDPKVFLRQAALLFYGRPSSKAQTIGITGTNGKTTVTYVLESIIHAAQKTCGVIGTINHRIGGHVLPSKNTTPGFLENQRYLAQLADLKAQFCVMEVSSHALDQSRVDGIDFAAGIFTNLTQDHLDYHKTMDNYFQAKSLLFTGLSHAAAAIINSDDDHGRRLTALSRGRIMTYGIDSSAQVRAQNIQYSLNGTRFDMVFPGGVAPVHTRLIGRHNVYNILAGAACAYSLGLSWPFIAQGIKTLKQVPGRLEPVQGPQDFFVFIDYAHTEDGLVNVLNALRAVSRDKIIVVFGCGGDRDRGKRPKMGAAVCALADHAIVTSDNPRSEGPQAIIDEIAAGFTKNNFEMCVDRRAAIIKALKMAKKGNIVLLAGKGHEDYQVLKEGRVPFDERKIVQEYLGVHACSS